MSKKGDESSKIFTSPSCCGTRVEKSRHFPAKTSHSDQRIFLNSLEVTLFFKVLLDTSIY